jgi:hypothetical protein
MVKEVQTNNMGLFQALSSFNDRLQSLADVMSQMSGFAPGEPITLSQNQVDILVSKLVRH